MPEPGRQYGGRSSEARRGERRERLLEAGLDLIGRDGLATLSVRGVCTEASLTPRYFYEEFGTVDALARALFDREFDGVLARVGEAVVTAGADATTHDRVSAALGAVLEAVTEVPARAAVLLTEASGTGTLAQRRQERMEDVIGLVGGFGRTTYGSGAPPETPEAAALADRAIRSAATFVAGGLAQSIDAWLRGQIPGEPEALQRELAAQIVAVGDAAFAELERALRSPTDPA
jgi:AcrR family transcriptional regulator